MCPLYRVFGFTRVLTPSGNALSENLGVRRGFFGENRWLGRWHLLWAPGTMHPLVTGEGGAGTGGCWGRWGAWHELKRAYRQGGGPLKIFFVVGWGGVRGVAGGVWSVLKGVCQELFIFSEKGGK